MILIWIMTMPKDRLKIDLKLKCIIGEVMIMDRKGIKLYNLSILLVVIYVVVGSFLALLWASSTLTNRIYEPWEDLGSVWYCEETNMTIYIPDEEYNEIICNAYINGQKCEFGVGNMDGGFDLLDYTDGYCSIVFSVSCRYHKNRFVCDVTGDELFGGKYERITFYRAE